MLREAEVVAVYSRFEAHVGRAGPDREGCTFLRLSRSMANDIITFEDSMMPRSTIKNCAKTVLKDDTPIQKDALTALTKGSSVFISYLTAQANEIALSKKRKTIMPGDVFEALEAIEFGRFVPDLRKEHERAEQEAQEKKERKKSGMIESVEGQESDLPPAKKFRLNGEDKDLEQADDRPDRRKEEDLGEESDAGDEPEEEVEEDYEEEEDVIERAPPQILDDGTHEPIIRDEALEETVKDTYDEALDNGEDSD